MRGLSRPSALTSTPALAARRARRLGLLVCSTAVFVVMLDGSIVNVALPTIGASFHTGTSSLQWIVDGYLLVLACSLLIAGAVGDRVGRRRLFRTGLVVFALASAGASLAPSLPSLVGFRMLQGLGAAMLPPSTLAIIAHTFPDPRQRARAMGIWGAVSGLAVAAGPLAGGLLVAAAGWRAIFWVNIPVLAAALFGTRRHVPESRAPNPRRLDLPGQALAAIGLATLTDAVIQAPGRGWAAPMTLILLAGAATTLASFVAVERHRAEPILAVGYFHDRKFDGVLTVAVLALFAVNGFTFLSTLYLQDIRGDSPLQAGIALLPATAVMLPLAPLSGRLTARHGPRPPLLLATASMTAGLLILTRVEPGTGVAPLAFAYLAVGVGAGMLSPPLTTTAVSALPPAEAGVASGVVATARQLGAVLGVAVLGSLLASATQAHAAPHPAAPDLLHATHLGFAVAASAVAVAAVITFLTLRSRGPNSSRGPARTGVGDPPTHRPATVNGSGQTAGARAPTCPLTQPRSSPRPKQSLRCSTEPSLESR